MGSHKRRQGVDGVRVGTGTRVIAHERKRGTARGVSMADVVKMPMDAARHLMRSFMGPNRKLTAHRKIGED